MNIVSEGAVCNEVDPDLDGLVDPDGDEYHESYFGEKDDELQRGIVHGILKHPAVCQVAAEYLSPTGFTQKVHQWIATIAIEHHNKYGAPPEKATLLHELRVKHGDVKGFDAYAGEARGLFDYYTGFHKDYLADKVKELAKATTMKRATAKWLESVNKGSADYGPVRDALTKIDRLDAKAEAVAYFPDELLALPPMEWAVDRHLPQGGFGCIYGPFGTGKSFCAIEMFLSIATGKPFLGKHEVRQGVVCFVAGEGYSGIRKRIWGWCNRNGVSTADLAGKFLVIPRQYDLLDPTQAQALADLAKQKLGRMPDWIVLDTLSKMFGSGDSNQPKDMGKYVNNLTKLQELGRAEGVPTGVVSIHHTGKDKSRGSMGAVVLPGACDMILSVDGDIAKSIEVTCTKQKDGERFAPYSLVADHVDVPSEIDPSGEGTLVLAPMCGAFPELPKGEGAAIVDLAAAFHEADFSWADAVKELGKNRVERYVPKLQNKGYLADGTVEKYRVNPQSRGAIAQLGARKRGQDTVAAAQLVRTYMPTDDDE